MGLLIINYSKTSVQSFCFCNFIIHRFSRYLFWLGVIWYVDLYTWYIPHVRITVPTQSNFVKFCLYIFSTGWPKNLVDLNFSLWMIFPQSFSHLSQFAYNFYVLSKMCSKWHPRRWRHTCIRRAKLSMTRTHSSLGISLIFAVIAALSSPIVWGLFSYTLSLRYPHR